MKIGHAIRRLRREAPSWKVTALAQVAAQWHDPFRVLVAWNLGALIIGSAGHLT